VAVEPAPQAQPVDPAQLASLLAELTQAVRKYGVDKQRVPKSLDELVAAGYLSQAPVAPAGKRFAISKTLQVELVDE
jgi:competence protein ComGC